MQSPCVLMFSGSGHGAQDSPRPAVSLGNPVHNDAFSIVANFSLMLLCVFLKCKYVRENLY